MAEPAAPAFSTLRYNVADAVATITLDRPDALNALMVASKLELRAAFERVAGDASVRAVVLTGAGRAFCSGQDLKERLEPGATPLDVAEMARERLRDGQLRGAGAARIYGLDPEAREKQIDSIQIAHAAATVICGLDLTHAECPEEKLC